MAKNASTHIFYDHPLKCYVKMCRKITKIVATRCQILRLKCTKFDFGRPRWGTYSTLPDPLTGGKKEGGKEKGGEGCPFSNSCIRHCFGFLGLLGNFVSLWFSREVRLPKVPWYSI